MYIYIFVYVCVYICLYILYNTYLRQTYFNMFYKDNAINKILDAYNNPALKYRFCLQN
jgi:hypothetical protein